MRPNYIPPVPPSKKKDVCTPLNPTDTINESSPQAPEEPPIDSLKGRSSDFPSPINSGSQGRGGRSR